MHPEQIAEIVARHLRREPGGIVAAYLFGSRARGDERPDSDVDLAVLFSEAPASTLDAQPFSLAASLSERIGAEVDLVVLNDAPVDLVRRVLRDGILVLDSNPSRRIAFEVQARNRYFDLLPFLKRYRGLEAS